MFNVSIDTNIAKKVFGFCEEILSNTDLPPFEYSSSRTAAAKVVEKVWLSNQQTRAKFNSFIENKFSEIQVGGGEVEFLLVITPDIICEAAIHAFT